MTPVNKEESSVPSEVRQFLSDIGRKGGCSKSEKKRAASIVNGMKGGRPRKPETAEAQA